MIDLDRHYGPLVGRVWGLILNLLANTLALYGLVGYLRGGTHVLYLVTGLVLTALCVIMLAKPSG
jgi:hypothetical protein